MFLPIKMLNQVQDTRPLCHYGISTLPQASQTSTVHLECIISGFHLVMLVRFAACSSDLAGRGTLPGKPRLGKQLTGGITANDMKVHCTEPHVTL